jgi:hypothetical protein
LLQNILDIWNVSIVADGSNVLKIQDVADGTLPNNTTRPQSLLGSLSGFPGSEIQRFRGAPAILDADIPRTSA